MGYANLEKVYWSGQVIDANLNGDAIDVRCVSRGVISLNWSLASATDAVVKLQESGTGDVDDWHDIATMTKAIDAPSGIGLFKLTDAILVSPWLRAVITAGTETTAVLNLKYFLKGDR